MLALLLVACGGHYDLAAGDSGVEAVFEAVGGEPVAGPGCTTVMHFPTADSTVPVDDQDGNCRLLVWGDLCSGDLVTVWQDAGGWLEIRPKVNGEHRSRLVQPAPARWTVEVYPADEDAETFTVDCGE